jgi:hypothetical protein
LLPPRFGINFDIVDTSFPFEDISKNKLLDFEKSLKENILFFSFSKIGIPLYIGNMKPHSWHSIQSSLHINTAERELQLRHCI